MKKSAKREGGLFNWSEVIERGEGEAGRKEIAFPGRRPGARAIRAAAYCLLAVACGPLLLSLGPGVTRMGQRERERESER